MNTNFNKKGLFETRAFWDPTIRHNFAVFLRHPVQGELRGIFFSMSRICDENCS